MSLRFLYFLESIRNPVLDAIMQFFTELGGEAVFMVVALAVFWCVSKDEGYYLLFVGFLGTILNQFLKLVFRIARPWVLDPKFTIVESARADATGYSFPSGHTQNVVGTLGGLARWNKQNWLRIACIATLLLTSFSRMYLGVHTPLDVGVSFVIAAVLVFGLYPIVRRCAAEPKKMYVLLAVMTAIATTFMLYANLTEFRVADEQLVNIVEGRKNSFSLLGALLGFCLGYTLERKYVQFDTKAVWWAQCFKVALGLVAVMAVKEGLKFGFSALGVTGLWTNAVRYFFVVVVAAVVWPLSFPWFARMGKNA